MTPLRWKAEWGWSALVVAVLGLSLFGLPRRARQPGDTFSTSPAGKRAFFEIVQKLMPGSFREFEAEKPPTGKAQTICILGPARYPTPAEWEALAGKVEGGASLVFAARRNDPAVELGPFGVSITSDWLGASRRHRARSSAGPQDSTAADTLGWSNGPAQTRVETKLATGTFDWSTAAAVRADSGGVEVLVSSHGRPQVIRKMVGAGQLIACGSDYIFSNAALASGDNGLLAFRILEQAGLGPVCFQEHWNVSGRASVLGVLVDPRVRAITFQLVIGAVLFAWLGSRRFGRPAVDLTASRKHIREHAEALGNLHYKTHTGARAVGWYLDYLLGRFGVRHSGAGRGQAAAALARRLGVEESVVAGALADAERVAATPAAGNAEAAGAIRRLTALTHGAMAAGGGRGAGANWGPGQAAHHTEQTTRR